MRLLIQRVSRASVEVGGTVTGEIGAGCLVFVGCRFDDTEKDAAYLAGKLCALRIFPDDEGKMNLSLAQTGGSALLVSQFTLYADTSRGNRPGFEEAGAPETAQRHFATFVSEVRRLLGSEKTATGIFAAEMRVSLINEGPVTINLTSDSQPWKNAEKKKHEV